MSRIVRAACGVALALSLLPGDAFGQRFYPPGYGRYGWGGWGTRAVDPAAGYMAGLGSYARGQGVYELLDAQAQAINFETMQKWNQALRARQQQLQRDRQEEQARARAERDARVARMELEDGTTLNNLLMQILEFDPNASRSSRAQAPIGAAAVREIPFEWNTEAITICIDQLTAKTALPDALSGDSYRDERAALGEAVEAALKEDAKGDVSPQTMKRLNTAIASFRAKFVKQVRKGSADYEAGDDYFNTLAGLTRLLHDPSMKKALGQLETMRDITIGDLIVFMQTYNLRFGPAMTARQLDIYKTLVGMLTAVKNDVAAGQPPAPPAPGVVDKNGKGLQDAAKDAFKGMEWQHLDAHARQP